MNLGSLESSSSRARGTKSLSRVRKQCQSMHPKASLSQTYSISLSRKREITTFSHLLERDVASGCILLQATSLAPISSAQPTLSKFSRRSSCIGHSLREPLPQLGPWPKDNFPNQGIEKWRVLCFLTLS